MEGKDKHNYKDNSYSKLLSNGNLEVNTANRLLKLHERYEKDALRYYRKGYTSPERKDTIKNKQHSNYYFRDDIYLKDLVTSENERNEEESKKKLTLKLPKLGSITQDNKAIFYTALPEIPSYKRIIVKKHTPERRRQKTTKLEHMNKYMKIQRLLGNQDSSNDVNTISQDRDSNGLLFNDFLPKINPEHFPNKAKVTPFKRLKGEVRFRTTNGELKV